MKTAEEIIEEKGGEIISVPESTTIHDALEMMLLTQVGAVIVTVEGRPSGIWTSRDLMKNVFNRDFDIRSARIGDYRTRKIHSAPHTDNMYNLMDKFLGLRVNHLLVEKEGEYIGLLSTGDVMKTLIQDKTQELDKLQAMVSWDYYEEWRWKPSKKNVRR